MSSKFTIIKLVVDGEHFEVLVYPGPALDYKMGKNLEISQVVAVEEVYSDASKGLRVSLDKFSKYFKTTETMGVIESILKKGELQLTTDQRRKMVEEKKKQIISIIARNFIDPRTGLPHPPVRIEQALQQVKVSVNPFRSGEEQAKLVVERLREVLPLKSELMRIQIKVPPQFAPQSIGALKSFSEIKKEDWGSDGSLIALIEIPAGVHGQLVERLGSITKGSAQVSIIR